VKRELADENSIGISLSAPADRKEFGGKELQEKENDEQRKKTYGVGLHFTKSDQCGLRRQRKSADNGGWKIPTTDERSVAESADFRLPGLDRDVPDDSFVSEVD
jgi:hypothetical protein